MGCSGLKSLQSTDFESCEAVSDSTNPKNTSPRGRTKTVISDKNIERVKRKLGLSPRWSTRSLARELHLSQSSVWRVFWGRSWKSTHTGSRWKKNRPLKTKNWRKSANFKKCRLQMAPILTRPQPTRLFSMGIPKVKSLQFSIPKNSPRIKEEHKKWMWEDHKGHDCIGSWKS